MDLNINSPAYYTGVYGIDDEIYWMCRELAQYVKAREYSKFIKTIGIVPIIAPEGEIKKGLWKELKHVSLKCGFASVCLQIQLAEGIEKIGAEIIVFKDISGSRNPDKLANH